MKQRIVVLKVKYRTYTNTAMTGGCLNESGDIKKVIDITEEVDAIINKKLEELNPFKDKEYHKVDVRSEFLDVVQFEEE